MMIRKEKDVKRGRHIGEKKEIKKPERVTSTSEIRLGASRRNSGEEEENNTKKVIQ
jgi:hypothetical protein